MIRLRYERLGLAQRKVKTGCAGDNADNECLHASLSDGVARNGTKRRRTRHSTECANTSQFSTELIPPPTIASDPPTKLPITILPDN